MKIFIAIILSGIISAAGTIIGIWQLSKTMMPQVVNVNSFDITTDRMAEDLQTKVVAIPPVGQLWAFTPEQKLNVNVLNKKATEEGVIVAVRLSTTASVQPPKPEKGELPAPVTVQLNGVAKLHYELLAGEWYLVDVTSVNLRASQK